MKKVQIIVHGNVQGVFFRANTKKAAIELGLNGFAKNLPDGSVEVIAEGQEDKLKRLIEYCKKGPERAQVSKVDVRFLKPTEEFIGFEVM